MSRSLVNIHQILHDNSIWETPHVVQHLHRGELRWDEFTRILISDLALGNILENWIPQLLAEGNVGLAHDLAKHTQVESKWKEHIDREEKEWSQILKMLEEDSKIFLLEKSNDLRETDLEAYNSSVDLVSQYQDERAYGEAVSTQESALQALKVVVQRRQLAAELAFNEADKKVGQARKVFASLKGSQSFNNSLSYADIIRLLQQSDSYLYLKEYRSAIELASWVINICTGKDFPIDTIKKILESNHTIEINTKPSQKAEDNDTIFVGDNDSSQESEHGRKWLKEEDEYIIDNYDVLNNSELMARLNLTDKEVENRIVFHGLTHERNSGKRTIWRNPYVAGKPLRRRTVFVGREDVFSFIAENLRYEEEEDRNLVVLLGHRRTGKTSILLQLHKYRNDILSPRIPVFVDMEGLLPFRGGAKNLFWKLAKRIQDEIMDVTSIKLPVPEEDEFIDPAWTFQRFLKDVREGTQGRGLVMLLDEFQLLEPRLNQIDVDVYKMLRSIIQHDSHIDFILSGTMEMERLMRSYEAAMFGSAISKKIDFLDRNDAIQLIVRPVQGHVTYSPEAIDLIIEVTASHPYFVQLVCWTLTRYLIDRGKVKATKQDVERVLPQALEQGVHFDEIWATDTPELEQYIMAVVAGLLTEERKWVKIQEVEKKLIQEEQMPRNADDLDEALLNLSNRRILRRSDDGNALRFHVDVFGKWVGTNKPFEVVRRDIRAEAARRRKRIERQTLST